MSEKTSAEVAFKREIEFAEKLKIFRQRENLKHEDIVYVLDEVTLNYNRLLQESKLLTSVGDRLQRKLKSANLMLKEQSEEIQRINDSLTERNVELQLALDELTKARASRKAQAYIYILAIFLFIVTEALEELFESFVGNSLQGFIISTILKVLMVLAIKPLEGYLEARFIRLAATQDKREMLDRIHAQLRQS